MVPEYARILAAVVGAFLIVLDCISLVGTLIVPRPAGGRLMIWVDRIVHAGFQLMTAPVNNYHRRDRILAAQAATLLICQLVAWLLVAYIGFGLLLWPFTHGGVTLSFDNAGPAFWFAGDFTEDGAAVRAILYAAALIGLVTVTLQIAYLPTLYSAFNRRETDVALLNARAGVPSWGPELLARTHYALGSGASTINTLPDLYDQWERWAADIAESHTTYLPLVLGHRTARGAGFRGDVPGAVPGVRADGGGPAVPARRFPVLHRGRPGHGPAGPGGARSCCGHQPVVRGLAGRHRGAGEGELPDRAHTCRGVAGLRRLAGQL